MTPPEQATEEPTVADATILAPAATTDPEATPDAPTTSGTSGDEQSVLERFKLEDVPEEYREHVERYVKQAQGDYTRKTTTLAEQRRAVEAEAAQLADWRKTIDALENEDTRDDAVAELIGKYGYTFEEAEQAAEDAAETTGEPTPETAEFRDSRVDALLAEQEADRQAQAAADAEADAQAERDRIMDHVDEGLAAFAEAEGLTLDTLPAHRRREIIAIAASLPRLEGDLPNMEAAVAEYEANRAADLDSYLATKRGTVPDVSGSTGARQVNLRDPKQRLAEANRIAEASFARHR